MPRHNIQKPALEPHQRALAAMIDDALNRGQRGDGSDPRHWTKWTNRGFAEKAVVAETSLANWRNPDKRMPPEDIAPLLKTFYGDIARHAADKAKMQRLWRLARGYIVDDESGAEGWDVGRPSRLQGTASLVNLLTHAPVPWNDGTLRMAVTLVITPDRDLSYGGRAMTIGLAEALLCMQSDGLQPAWKSLPSQRGLANFALDAAGERIVGPIDPATGMINGEPLGDEHFFTFEPAGAGEACVTVSIHAPRGCFRVLPSGSGSTAAKRKGRSNVNQNAVINALFHEQLRTRDDHDRPVLARATVGSRRTQCP